MNNEAKAFFEENPGVKMVLQVGADIYLASSMGAAKEHAKQFGLDVVEIYNERPIEDEQPEDEFEKQNATDGAVAHVDDGAENAKPSTDGAENAKPSTDGAENAKPSTDGAENAKTLKTKKA